MASPLSNAARMQAETRSYVVPILLALMALGVAVMIAIHFFPATSVGLATLKTELYSGDVTFKADSIVLGQDQTTHVLFIAATLKVQNRLRTPVVVDNFILTITDPSGAQLEAHAPLTNEIQNLETTYPALKTLLRQPLQRETAIKAGADAEGTVLFSLPIPRATWDARQTAVVTAEIYHQHAASVALPKN